MAIPRDDSNISDNFHCSVLDPLSKTHHNHQTIVTSVKIEIKIKLILLQTFNLMQRHIRKKNIEICHKRSKVVIILPSQIYDCYTNSMEKKSVTQGCN